MYTGLLSLSRSVARYRLKSCKCSAQVDTRMIEASFRGFLRGRLILNRNIFAIKHLARTFAAAADLPRRPACTRRIPRWPHLFARNNPDELKEKPPRFHVQASAGPGEEQGFTQTFDLVHNEGNLLYVVATYVAGTTFFFFFLSSQHGYK